MPFVCIFGTRLFGACDYFTVEEQEMFVRTKFYHFNFMPCAPEESFLFVADGRAIELPEVVGRSVGWAWLRYLAWVVFLTVMCVAVIFLTTGLTEEWWPWVLVALSAVFLGLAIFLTVYKPKASEESKQEYLNMVGQVVARRYLHEQMAAAAAVHGGPAHEVVAIEQPPPYPGLHKDNVNVMPIAGSPTPTPGNPNGFPTPGNPNGFPTPGNPNGFPTHGNPNGFPTPGNPNGFPTPGNPYAV
ncbi:Hypp1955 [Branchiostoma lanceolatum]|uniref:Hypp1955 protein n=1 Tax=Branchiostoma lanceolatum TaxID=7740 RepID=A0A8K0EQP2_BRALA|nr:Hypp1955 [Branchiostoma lanceolatum]